MLKHTEVSLQGSCGNQYGQDEHGMPKHACIYVAGHRGLVGSAVVRQLQAHGYHNLRLPTSQALDLTDQRAVNAFFESERPAYVFLCAAKVGGIKANATQPADFIYQNLMIQTNVIHAAFKNNVQRLIFLGSSCIYPKLCPQPIQEKYLLTGPLEPTNRPYALAKISGIEMCWSYNRQFGTKFLTAMPTNLYGPNDNFDLQNSHVLPAIMRKMHAAKEAFEGDSSRSNAQAESCASGASVKLWGSGRARREFLHVDDLAQALLCLLNLPESSFASLCDSKEEPPILNVGCGQDLSIAELAALMAQIVGFSGRLEWDTSQPDGTPQKLLDISRLKALGWRPQISLEQGIADTYHLVKEKLSRLNQPLAGRTYKAAL